MASGEAAVGTFHTWCFRHLLVACDACGRTRCLPTGELKMPRGSHTEECLKAHAAASAPGGALPSQWTEILHEEEEADAERSRTSWGPCKDGLIEERGLFMAALSQLTVVHRIRRSRCECVIRPDELVVRLVTLAAQEWTLLCHHGITLREFKSAAAAVTGLPSSGMHLVCGEKHLLDPAVLLAEVSPSSSLCISLLLHTNEVRAFLELRPYTVDQSAAFRLHAADSEFSRIALASVLWECPRLWEIAIGAPGLRDCREFWHLAPPAPPPPPLRYSALRAEAQRVGFGSPSRCRKILGADEAWSLPEPRCPCLDRGKRRGDAQGREPVALSAVSAAIATSTQATAIGDNASYCIQRVVEAADL